MPPEVIRRIATLPDAATALTMHTMNGQPMPIARHIVTEEHPQGVYLFRYSGDWHFAGDTWHENIKHVLAQIEYEFGLENLAWRPIKDDELSALTTRK